MRNAPELNCSATSPHEPSRRTNTSLSFRDDAWETSRSYDVLAPGQTKQTDSNLVYPADLATQSVFCLMVDHGSSVSCGGDCRASFTKALLFVSYTPTGSA